MPEMEWKSVVARLRKEMSADLKAAGYVDRKQGIWDRDFGFWRGRIQLSITSRNKGLARTIYLGVSLIRSEELTPEQIVEQKALGLPGTKTYAVYSIKFPTEVDLEWWPESPEECDKIRGEVLEELRRDWIPWHERQSAVQGMNLEGARRQHHGVPMSMDYVP